MKKTIKIIDLLNKIANREEVPKKIKYDTKIMEYSTGKQDYLGYYSNGNGSWLFQFLFDKCRNTEYFINDYVEILDEQYENIEEVSYKYVNTYGNVSQHRKSEEPLIDTINALIRNQKKIIKIIGDKE